MKNFALRVGLRIVGADARRLTFPWVFCHYAGLLRSAPTILQRALSAALLCLASALPEFIARGAAVAPMAPQAGALGYQQGRLEPLLPASLLEAVSPIASSSVSKGRLQIGVGRTFGSPIHLSRRIVAAEKWHTLANGWRLWSAEVISQGAVGIRLHLESVALPAGVRLLVYDPANPAAVTRAIAGERVPVEGDTWTETLFAERVVLECQVPPGTDTREVSFSITGLAHLYRSPRATPGPLMAAGSCNKDVSCYPEWAQQAAGVARISFVDHGDAFLCTGCLLSDTAPNSQLDYFLTAFHCVHSQTIASTIEFDWFDQTSRCNGSPPANWPRTSGGASFLAGSARSDFGFLRLRQNPPNGVYRLAWSRTAPSRIETLTCIEHPAGDYKRISFGNLAGSDSDFWTVGWFSGVTEEGSSGSPLLNASHQVIGQLYGGESSCDNLSGLDTFGRFDVSYQTLKRWLLLQGTYRGLFQDPAGIAPQSSGSFVLTTTSKGKFTGSLQLNGARYSMSGQLDENGNAPVTIDRHQLGPLSIQLQVDLSQGSDRVTGTISNETWVATLMGDRAVFDGKNSIAPQNGRYTVVFPGNPDSATEPAGDSYGTLSVDKAGRIRLSGLLADGTRISQASVVSKYGQWPFYVSLYGGQGLIFSWVSFDGSPVTELNGDLSWVKPSLPKAKFYGGGFTNGTPVSGSPYARPSAGEAILNFTLGEATLTGGDLPQAINNEFTLGSDNRVTNETSSNKFGLTFALGSGAFSGRVAAPASSSPIKFGGVVLQNQNTGAGCFLGATQSGRVALVMGQ